MVPGSLSERRRAWRAFLVVAAIVLYAISLSGTAYDLTSPVALSYHEVLRKTYAVLAFALLGFAFQRSRFRRASGVLEAGIVLALYSWAIEIGQIVIDRSSETFAEHSFDVASGLVGGALGAFAALVISAPRDRARRLEGMAIVVALAALAWAFTATYGRVRYGYS
jgi:hypothetical protein